MFDPSGVPAPQEPPVILADLLGDDSNGRDYLSLTRSGNPLDMHVRHSFATLRDTGACARDHGHRFAELRHMDELAPAVVETIAQEAVQHLIDRGYLELLSVTLNADVDEGRVHLVYRDLINNLVRELDVL